MHLWAELTAAVWTLKPFGEIGANFSLQLSSRTRFDKINKKKVIPENQCEKHKKSSLVTCTEPTVRMHRPVCIFVISRFQTTFSHEMTVISEKKNIVNI